ncbi:hypothetical protein A2973_05200 [Candidatus Gottesmanbacteria bacterium RIFCSPLOWO2_01_FULL_49_10]|uniref:Cupin type-2 domain-containing protein n=1 Tax=Candidatus Gottesmanbacteria bacterium RIFCSPLOWO2_01_FULL_49_10 TaxID=1798396 RepID=A0A1F6AZA5_9BACT|nr:MAG: hypothetical protein A2973_05200 [Candidatus Gottesmanbacteria bacterium RIFCSPLOWO2_01_FULL_49_10]
MQVIRLHDLPQVPASHENQKDPSVLKQILLRREDLALGRIQMINWAILLPGKSFRLHSHEDMEEVFIILGGKAEITVGEEKELLMKGDVVVIPERSIHTMKNVTAKAVTYLVIGIARERGGKTVIV